MLSPRGGGGGILRPMSSPSAPLPLARQVPPSTPPPFKPTLPSLVDLAAGGLGPDLLAVRGPSDRDQHQVVDGGVGVVEAHVDSVAGGLGPGSLGLEQDATEPRRVPFLPDLYQVPVRARHQAI